MQQAGQGTAHNDNTQKFVLTTRKYGVKFRIFTFGSHDTEKYKNTQLLPENIKYKIQKKYMPVLMSVSGVCCIATKK